MKRRFHCPICAHSGLSLRCLTVSSRLYRLVDLQEIETLVSWAHSDGSDEHHFMRSLARAFAVRIN